MELERNISVEVQTKMSTYEQKIYTFTQQITDYESRTSQMKHEMERLNQIIRIKTDEEQNHERIIKSLQMEIQNYQSRLSKV